MTDRIDSDAARPGPCDNAGVVTDPTAIAGVGSDDRPPGELNEAVDFDPFQAIPVGREFIRRCSTRALLGLLPVLAALVIIPCVIEGTIGSEFRPVTDLRLALGTPGLASPASFPLTRDTPSMWFLLVIVLTCMLVHRQWHLMAACVPGLRSNGVIMGRRGSGTEVPHRGRLQRAVGVLFGSADGDQDELEVVLGQLQRFMSLVEKHSWFPAILAGLLAYLLTVGEQHGLFTSIVPSGLTVGEQAQWLQGTYASWWASTDHFLGFVVYLMIAWFGLYVIIVQNIVGVACTYFAVSLFGAAHVTADWLNVDKCFGWRPVAEAFRTVYLSLMLHGLTLVVIIVAIGPAQYVWIAALLLIWLVVTPLYLVAPYLAFRSVERAAKAARRSEIEAQMSSANVTRQSPVDRFLPYATEMERVNKARIRPLRMGAWGPVTAFTAVIFPVVLAVLQEIV